MRSKIRSWVVVAGLPLALGCGGPAKNAETISIGSILPLTGTSGTTDLRESIALALDEINAAGGVLDSELEHLSRDDNSDKDRAKAAALELAEKNVPVIIGGWASSVSLEIATVTSEKGIVQVSGSSSSPALTTLADNGYVFRTIASDTLQGELLAKRAREKGFEKVAVIHIPGAYGEGLAKTFADHFTAAGGTVSAQQAYTEGQTDHATLLDQVFETQPQAVVLVAYPADGAQIVSDWLDSAHVNSGAFWFFTDGVKDPGFITAVGESRFTFQHEGSGPGTPDSPRYEAFKAAFKSRYGRDPGTYAANFYDATYLALLAMEAAGEAEGAAVKAKMAEVSAGGQPFGPGEFSAAAAALEGGTDIDYQGASGDVDFDENGDVPGTYDIWDVKDGKVRIVEQAVRP